jgi:PiT family inorganic phosphate transporter
MIYFYLTAAVLLGWALGANDSANCFGTAVVTHVIKYGWAVSLTAVLVAVGACMEGSAGIEKIGEYAAINGIATGLQAFIVMGAAAVTVVAMTFFKLPVSTSQAVVGAIIGSGLTIGRFDIKETLPFFGAWFATPLGAMAIGYILYSLMSNHVQKRINNIELFDRFIKIGFILSGAFSAYALGANNVANVSAVFVGRIDSFSVSHAVVLGGISIAFGALTYSKPVMMTVGKGIVPLNPVSGFISVLSAALVVYFYAQVGIPVSTSQAIVGAVFGIGLVKGMQTVNFKVIRNIVLAWFGTPSIAGLISFVLLKIAG